MTVETFQRARRPEQITARREAILAAAAELFDEAGVEGTGLNAIAARAGFTKSNVYRYFESREAVLLSLFIEDFEALAADIEQRLAATPRGDIAAVAHRCTEAFLSHPRVCQLMAILSSVLERNVSRDAVVALKTEMLGQARRIADALAGALPQLRAEDCAFAASVVGTFVSGLWPAAHPSSTVIDVVARPEFAMLKPSLEHDLERTIYVLLKGLRP